MARSAIAIMVTNTAEILKLVEAVDSYEEELIETYGDSTFNVEEMQVLKQAKIIETLAKTKLFREQGDGVDREPAPVPSPESESSEDPETDDPEVVPSGDENPDPGAV